MARQEERVMVAEILDPVPERVRQELTSREWILERGEDVEGQGFRYYGVGQTQEDVEGQGFRWSFLRPAGEEDTEGESLRVRYLRPGGVDDDSEGEIQIRLRPQGTQPEDTSGQSWKRQGQTEEDTEGQFLKVRFVKTD
jgi:hypothetical protein